MAKLTTIKLNLLRLNGEKKKKKKKEHRERETERESLHRIYGIIGKKKVVT
jgi:hypothetical protein